MYESVFDLVKYRGIVVMLYVSIIHYTMFSEFKKDDTLSESSKKYLKSLIISISLIGIVNLLLILVLFYGDVLRKLTVK